MTQPTRRKQKSGYIFLQAVIALAGLTALMAMIAADERASVNEVQARMDQRRASEAALAGIARAEADLSDANINLVQQTDDWYTDGRVGTGSGTNPASDSFQLTGTDGSSAGTFRMQIIDAASLVNVNTAADAQLTLLPIDTDQVDSLLDWVSTSTTSTYSDGAKDDFYNSLDTPYNTKLGPLSTVDELLLVDNWTPQTLYQAPTDTVPAGWPTDTFSNNLPIASVLTVDSGAPNTEADGTARTNFSTNVSQNTLRTLGIFGPAADQIAGSTYTNFAGLLAVRGINSTTATTLLNDATFSTATRLPGKINLNTASEGVLMTIPNMTSDIASSIVTQQQSGFATLGALATVQGVSTSLLAQIADYFSIGTDTWIVRTYGESGGASVAMEAIIRVTNSDSSSTTSSTSTTTSSSSASSTTADNQVQVISQQRINSLGVPNWWGWDTKTDSTVDAGNTQ